MDEDGYHPEYLAVERALGFRPGLTGTAEERQVQYDAMLDGLAAQWPTVDSVEMREESINEFVRARIYTPKDAPSTAKLPVAVFFHGGGWISGTLDSEDPHCRIVVRDTKCVLVSIHYRLAPRHPMPIPIDDCLLGFEWAFENADAWNGDRTKYFTLGGSAGGHLALAVANRLVASGRRSQLSGCVVVNPITCHPDHCPEEYKPFYRSYAENGNGVPIVDESSMRSALEGAKTKPDDADVFPVLSPHLGNFPPTWIATCGKDCLRDDGVILEMMLEKAGVKTKRVHYEGFPHYFHVIYAIPTSQVLLRDMVEGIRFVLS